jgi:hypothetical protein
MHGSRACTDAQVITCGVYPLSGTFSNVIDFRDQSIDCMPRSITRTRIRTAYSQVSQPIQKKHEIRSARFKYSLSFGTAMVRQPDVNEARRTLMSLFDDTKIIFAYQSLSILINTTRETTCIRVFNTQEPRLDGMSIPPTLQLLFI